MRRISFFAFKINILAKKLPAEIVESKDFRHFPTC